jgi:hypothetical protein
MYFCIHMFEFYTYIPYLHVWILYVSDYECICWICVCSLFRVGWICIAPELVRVTEFRIKIEYSLSQNHENRFFFSWFWVIAFSYSVFNNVDKSPVCVCWWMIASLRDNKKDQVSTAQPADTTLKITKTLY